MSEFSKEVAQSIQKATEEPKIPTGVFKYPALAYLYRVVAQEDNLRNRLIYSKIPRDPSLTPEQEARYLELADGEEHHG